MRKINTILISLILPLLLAATGYGQDYSVIVNKANSAESISKADLKRIYLGKMNQWNGSKVIPINLPESDATAQKFIDDVTKKDYGQYKKYWVAQQIKGAGSAPMEQKTIAAVKLIVSEIPGAIAYIPTGEVDDTVKAIKLE